MCKTRREYTEPRFVASRVREEKQAGTSLTIRTTRCVACFNEPFSLRNVEGVLPPADYNVYLEDELIPGLSRGVSARVHDTSIAVDIVSAGAIPARFHQRSGSRRGTDDGFASNSLGQENDRSIEGRGRVDRQAAARERLSERRIFDGRGWEVQAALRHLGRRAESRGKPEDQVPLASGRCARLHHSRTHSCEPA